MQKFVKGAEKFCRKKTHEVLPGFLCFLSKKEFGEILQQKSLMEKSNVRHTTIKRYSILCEMRNGE